MNQTFMKFLEDENNEKADLYVYGDIVEYAWWEEDISASDIRKKLEETTAKTINVHINSLGGDTFTGLAIYNLLRSKSKVATIVTYVDAIAASAASIIAMAGDKIIMPSNTLMMIHNCWTYTLGNSSELRKTADDMDKIMTAVIECYMAKININKEELQILLDEETYLTAHEALEKGFCDEILELNEEKGMKQNVLSSLTNIIEEYKSKKGVKETDYIVSQITTEKEKNKSDEKPSLFNLK